MNGRESSDGTGGEASDGFDAADTGGSRYRGRRALLLVGLAGVLSGGVLGAFAGSNSAETVPTVDLFGLVTVQTSGTTLGVFGAFVGLAIVALLFGLVEVASRLEDRGV
ncbi:hypothetical protein ACFO0N_00225 [Halobium salinum]|uniref:Cox cluster protein n=1 Tax=Halobium salinum TaxID=1364940 RepID=A0ABD5P682_9EURY|nr:hypothetical protein [Halobium salinum]